MNSLGGWGLLGFFLFFFFVFRSVFRFGSSRSEVDIHQTGKETLVILILALALFAAFALLELSEGTGDAYSLGRPIAAGAGALVGYGLMWFFNGKPADRSAERLVAGGPRRRRMEEIMLRKTVWDKATLPMVVGGAMLTLFGCGLLAKSGGEWRTIAAFAFIAGGAAIAISGIIFPGREFRGKIDQVHEEFPELRNLNMEESEKELENELGKSALPNRSFHTLMGTPVFPRKKEKTRDPGKE